MHDIGYSYIGQNSLYDLTWIEIFRLFEGFEIQSKIQQAVSSGARRSDYEQFEKFNKRMKQKYQG